MYSVVQRHFIPLLSAILLSFGLQASVADSLWVRGGLLPAADSSMVEINWHLNGEIPESGSDTLWKRVPLSGGLFAWARTDSTQVQLEADWPRMADSVDYTLSADSTGLTVVLGADSLHADWKPAQSGCFPAASKRDFDLLVASLAELPFESRRHETAVLWMQRHCLTLTALRRLADTFDDEGRRLSLLQGARVTNPDALSTMGSLFFTNRYEAEFHTWLKMANHGD